jgi:TusA-related sulfurtransferase
MSILANIGIKLDMTEKTEYNIKHTVDTCGFCCPIPMISVIKTLSRLDKGTQIEVKATDSAFEEDIRKVSDMGKCKVIFEEDREDYMYYIIEKI